MRFVLFAMVLAVIALFAANASACGAGYYCGTPTGFSYQYASWPGYVHWEVEDWYGYRSYYGPAYPTYYQGYSGYYYRDYPVYSYPSVYSYRPYDVYVDYGKYSYRPGFSVRSYW